MLDNLRKRATEASGESESADAPVPAAESDTTADDAWLVGVDRRSQEFEAPAPAEDVTAAQGFGPSSAFAAPATPDSESGAVPPVEPSVSAPQAVPSALQSPSAHEDLGMVYAGLEQPGLGLFPSEDPTDNGSDPIQPFPSIETGPIGPEAAVHLATLDLSVGCTWDDVTMARRRVLESLTDDSAEAWNQRVEVNHAAASLRLLRVGPLKH